MHYPKLFNGLFHPLTHHQPLIEYYSHFPLSFILIIFRASCFSFFQGPFDYLFLLLTASLSLSLSVLLALSLSLFFISLVWQRWPWLVERSEVNLNLLKAGHTLGALEKGDEEVVRFGWNCSWPVSDVMQLIREGMTDWKGRAQLNYSTLPSIWNL